MRNLLILLLATFALSAKADVLTLGWKHSTVRADGTALPITEIDHYELKQTVEGGETSFTDVAVDSGCETDTEDVCFTTGNLLPGTYIFSVKVYDKFGLQGQFREPSGATIDRSNPISPPGVTILEIRVVIAQ